MNVWDKLTRFVVVLSLAAAVLADIVWYQPKIAQNRFYRQRKLALEQQIDLEMSISNKLAVSFKAMEDPRTIERLARETWCYAKPGETVIHFDLPAPQSNKPAGALK